MTEDVSTAEVEFNSDIELLKQELEIQDEPELKQELEVPVEEELSIEEQARKQGWRPKEEFDGDEEDFVSAEEYVGRSPLYRKINKQNKEIRELQEAFKELGSHMKKREKLAYERAIKELAEERSVAVQNGDTDTFNKIDTELESLKQQMQEVKPEETRIVEPVKQAPPEVDAFVKRNKWFNGDSVEDKIMTSAAYTIDDNIKRNNPDISTAEEMNLLEKELMKMFPHKYQNTRRTRASDVSSSINTPSSKTKHSKIDWNSLSPIEKQTARKADLIEGYSAEQYIRELRELGDK